MRGNEKNMEKSKQNESDKKKIWRSLFWILLIVAIIIIVNSPNNAEKMEDYTWCVELCGLEGQSCIYSLPASTCASYSLSCIYDCEPD